MDILSAHWAAWHGWCFCVDAFVLDERGKITKGQLDWRVALKDPGGISQPGPIELQFPPGSGGSSVLTAFFMG